MRDSLSEEIYQTLKQEITDGKLPKNTILSERQIAERFNVSKAPVKSALKRLCEEYYLVSFPRKGYIVNILTRDEFNQICEVRAHYEQLSIDLAVKNASDEEIESLKDIRLSSSLSETGNTLFHVRMAEIGHNIYHLDLIRRLMSFQALLNYDTEQVDRSHARIIEALLERDADKAKQMLQKDIYPSEDEE